MAVHEVAEVVTSLYSVIHDVLILVCLGKLTKYVKLTNISMEFGDVIRSSVKYFVYYLSDYLFSLCLTYRDVKCC